MSSDRRRREKLLLLEKCLPGDREFTTSVDYHRARRLARVREFYQSRVAPIFAFASEVVEERRGAVVIEVRGREHLKLLTLEIPTILDHFNKSDDSLLTAIRRIIPRFRGESIPFENPPEGGWVELSPSPFQEVLRRVAGAARKRRARLMAEGFRQCSKCFSFFKESACFFCYNGLLNSLRSLLHQNPHFSIEEMGTSIPGATPEDCRRVRRETLDRWEDRLELLASLQPASARRAKALSSPPELIQETDGFTAAVGEAVAHWVALTNYLPFTSLTPQALAHYPLPAKFAWSKPYLFSVGEA